MTNKYLKIFSLLILITISIFFITGCSSDSEDALSSSKRYNVNFAVTAVTDETDETEEAVPAAALKLAGEEKLTDAEGVVSFSKPNGEYDYEVSAFGYNDVFDSIVVAGEDFLVDVKLSSEDNNSEPGDTEEEDTTAPELKSLYAWINEEFYGLNIGLIEGLIDVENYLDQNYDYFILLFSEKVEVKALEKLEEVDFEIEITNITSIEILDVKKPEQEFEFLILKIDDNIITDEMLFDDTVKFSVKINESGRKKIFDLAGNMLAQRPARVELKDK